MDNSTGPNLELVKTALDKLVDDSTIELAVTGKATALDEMIFTQDGADKAAVVAAVEGGGGYFEKTINDVSTNKNVTMAASTPKTIIMAQFKKDMPISRTFMADQQLNAVSKGVKKQAATWVASRDRNAMAVYGNGFTGAGNSTTYDGVPLFSNNHVNLNGDTVDNLETGALTDPNLNIVVDSLRTQLSQEGTITGYEPKWLLVSSIQHQTAMQITKSVLRAGTGNNDLNYFSEMYPGMMVKYSPFLNSFSTSAYYVGSATHGVTRYEREEFFTTLIDWKFDTNDMYKYKMRAREEVDALEYSGLVASNGTTA